MENLLIGEDKRFLLTSLKRCNWETNCYLGNVIQFVFDNNWLNVLV